MVVKKSRLSLLHHMGSFIGAEVCELVDLYLLDKLSKLLGSINVYFYRGYGLSLMQDANGPKPEKLRKDIAPLFKNEELPTTIEFNLLEIQFVDVFLKLLNGKYSSHKKSNNNPLYIKSKLKPSLTIYQTIASHDEQRNFRFILQ